MLMLVNIQIEGGLINCAVTVKLICVFASAYAKVFL